MPTSLLWPKALMFCSPGLSWLWLSYRGIFVSVFYNFAFVNLPSQGFTYKDLVAKGILHLLLPSTLSLPLPSEPTQNSNVGFLGFST